MKTQNSFSVRQIFASVAIAAAIFAAAATGQNFLDTRKNEAGVIAASSPAATAGVTDPSVASDERNNIEVYRALAPGVVFITAGGGRGSYDDGERRGSGSGSIIDKQGHILTNEHVVARAGRITVSLGGERSYAARVVGRDPDTDLAIIKIDAPASELTVVPFGESDTLEVGQKVLAIGNPFGLDRTLTTGVISGLQRPIRARNGRQIEGAIQTDASINPGNSGGPLLDSRGRMIGINSQILSPSGASNGIGFAVPSNIARRVVPQLIRSGYVNRPRLGISTRALRGLGGQADLPESGVLIMGVEPGSGAAQAGLRPTEQTEDGVRFGDVITRIGNETINNTDDLTRALDKRQVGDTVRVEVVRGGRRVTVPVRLGPARPLQ
ncbi:MAG: S1C family serine protease [Blastocatellia bacterium]